MWTECWYVRKPWGRCWRDATGEKACVEGEGVLAIVFPPSGHGFFSSCLPIISHLVDPASSHMLSSKAKPCMSKYKGTCPKLRTAHYNGRNLHGPILFFSRITLGT